MFVSVTRLRIRSIRFLPAFLLNTQRTGGQIRAAAGFLGGELVVDRKLTFWTMTGWVDERAMLGYRNSGAHKAVMPKLIQWCDEAAAVHWTQEGAALPSWKEAHAKLTVEGFVTKVRHPSANHTTRAFAEPRTTIGQKLVVK